MKNMLKKMRERGSWWMALLFLIIGLIAHPFNSNIGLAFEVASLFVLLGILIFSVLVSALIRLVDIKAEKQIKDYLSLVSWVVVVVMAGLLVSPLGDWIKAKIMGLF